MFDKRGTGLSDRVAIATLEERMDDVRAVMDAAGSPRAVIFGSSEGGALAILFSVTYPERVSALVLYGAYPRGGYVADDSEGLSDEAAEDIVARIETGWGQPGAENPLRFMLNPVQGADPAYQRAMARYERLSASPGAVAAILRMILAIDVRHLLSAVHVPTLVVYRTADLGHADGSRYLGAHIPGAKVVELPGEVYFPYLGDQDAVVDEIEEFLTGVRPATPRDRVLATVLFTDIVGSTATAVKVGDRRWRDLLDNHMVLSARVVGRHRGRVVKSTGDGVLATFDGPARAVRCACELRDAVKSSGLEIRAGLHTGEIELIGDDIGGIAVNIGQRVSSLASAREVLVSRTVVDLVAGSGLEFEDRGEHELKGVPGSWRLFQVVK
jgi:class 3 adenylate cyclase/pimeloyl-ACP methyl ester carboxylesterase